MAKVDTSLVAHLPLFAGFKPEELEEILREARSARYPKNTAVFEQGEEGDDFYVIEQGTADVISSGQPLSALGPGEGFGEIALLHDSPRTASVHAKTPLTLRALSRPVFVAAVTGYPQSKQAADHVITTHLIRSEAHSSPRTRGRLPRKTH